jgi:hypothetical protein
MAAEADDLRYFYAETLGRTIEKSCAAGASTLLTDEKLEPGRYILRVLDFGGGTSVWVRQGEKGDTTAAAAAPSTQFLASLLPADLNRPLCTLMVRGSQKDNALAVFSVGGIARVQLTKVSRGKA